MMPASSRHSRYPAMQALLASCCKSYLHKPHLPSITPSAQCAPSCAHLPHILVIKLLCTNPTISFFCCRVPSGKFTGQGITSTPSSFFRLCPFPSAPPLRSTPLLGVSSAKGKSSSQVFHALCSVARPSERLPVWCKRGWVKNL
jgi:hypothetical protein